MVNLSVEQRIDVYADLLTDIVSIGRTAEGSAPAERAKAFDAIFKRAMREVWRVTPVAEVDFDGIWGE